MGVFEDSLEASMLSIGRNPEWQNPAYPQVSGVADASLLPETAINGVALGNSPKCIVWFAPRELMHGHGARVRVTTVLDTDTYTVGLGEVGGNVLDHDYLATGGDLEADIIDGLVLEINTGVDLLTLGGTTIAYVNANPDTITRLAGSWITDGVNVGDRVTPTHTAANGNDGLTYTVAGVTALVLTLVAADDVAVEATSATDNFVVQRPVTASRETRSGVETLVITRKRLDESEVDDPANNFTTAVSTLSTGVLEFDEDAIGGDVTVYLTARGSGSLQPAASQWIAARNGAFTGIDHLGLVERVDTAGFGRIYPQVTNVTSPTTGATVTYTIKAAPAILE
jgi:hypothetical protein